MADRVVVHIGPRKTATTYLQRALQALVESGELASGVYPIRTRGRLDHNHVPGLVDLLRPHLPLQGDAWTEQDGGDAAALLAAVGDAPGTVVLSAEALSVLRSDGIAALVAALAPGRVEVVVTLRDLGRILPSSWQQHVRNGNIEDYATYLDLRVAERAEGGWEDRPDRAFWRAYAYGGLVRRWAAHAPVTVATVPPPGAPTADIWRRFRTAAGLDDLLPPTPPEVADERANRALTAAESFVVHGLNVAARAAGRDRRKTRAWHRAVLAAHADPRGGRLLLPPQVSEAVSTWAREDVHDLAATGVRVVGALDDLTLPPPSGPLPDPEQIALVAGEALARALSQRRRPGASPT